MRRTGYPAVSKSKLTKKQVKPQSKSSKTSKKPYKQRLEKKTTELEFLEDVNITQGQIKKVKIIPFTIEYADLIFSPKIILAKIPPRPANYEELMGTVYDPRMGPSSYWSDKCPACSKSSDECSGHMGHIRLQIPIINTAAGKALQRFLNLICFNCHQFFMPEETIRSNNLTNLNFISKLAILDEKLPKYKNLRDCPKCGYMNYLVNYDKDKNKIKANDGYLSTEEIIAQFNAIESDNAGRLMLKSLGTSDLTNTFFITVIGVIPPIMRESEPKGVIATYRDSFRDLYRTIISINIKISEENKTENRLKLINGLHNAIMRLFEGQKSKFKTAWNSNKQSYKDILTGKKGHIRHFQMGSRVDHTLRSVLTINPFLELPYITISNVILDKMYKEEYITHDTLPSFNKLLENDELIHYIPSSGEFKGQKRLISTIKETLVLIPGAKVTRKIKNGDDIIFGRNPSIHTPSIMSHKILIDYDSKCIGIHTASTTPYNADCDGDEGHGKIPQNYLAVAEAKYVTNAIFNMRSSETGGINMGLVIDNLTGIFIMTSPDECDYHTVRDDIYEHIRQNFITNELDQITYEQRLKKYNMSKKSTRGMLSMIFPFAFSYQIKQEDNIVVIRDGILLRGKMNKKVFGVSRNHNNIGQYITHFWGEPRYAQCITDITRLINYWLSEQRGFTVGLADVNINTGNNIMDNSINIAKHQTINETAETVKILEKEKQNAEFIEKVRIENEIVSVIEKKIEGFGRKLTRKLLSGSNNNFQPMHMSNAKGDLFHITQMIAMLGQPYVSGQRINPTLNNNTRSSIYAQKNSNSIEDYGFADRSYTEGMTPKQMDYYSRPVRQNIYNMSTTTAPTGDLHHRFAKSVEDITVQYDGTLRDAVGTIIDFLPAGVGIDPRRQLLVTHENITAPWFTDVSYLIDILNSEIEFGMESIVVPNI